MATQNRFFSISDEGDAFDLSLYQDGAQVAGGIFPVDVLGVDGAFALAEMVGKFFVQETTKPPIQVAPKGRMITS